MLLATSASAVEVEIAGVWYDVVTKVKEATVIQYKNSKYSGGIVIPETIEYDGNAYSVTSIGECAFSDCTSLTSVTIPNSVTSIGNSAFTNCASLTSVTIPDGVTSIGMHAFFGCSGLTSLVVGNNVASIGVSAFAYCPLKKVIVKDITAWCKISFDNLHSNPLSISHRLYNAEGIIIRNLVISDNVTSIGNYAFEDSGLTSVTIPNSVTTIGDGAFNGCALTTVTIGNSVASISFDAFANCSSLTDVYCLAENVPSTDSDAFVGSSINTATLHVPNASIVAYQTAAPWSGFKAIVGLDGTTPETKKCATPTISLVDGELVFGCETEGVEFVSEVTVSDAKKYNGNKVSLTGVYKVSVYATKDGYLSSDVATAEFTMSAGSGKRGDINTDGTVNALDVQEVINIAADTE